MPLYDYKCDACLWTGSKIVKTENSDRQSCPQCNSLLRKILSAPTTIKINGIKATASQK
jgi:putative FmdB family regulatory protein